MLWTSRTYPSSNTNQMHRPHRLRDRILRLFGYQLGYFTLMLTMASFHQERAQLHQRQSPQPKLHPHLLLLKAQVLLFQVHLSVLPHQILPHLKSNPKTARTTSLKIHHFSATMWVAVPIKSMETTTISMATPISSQATPMLSQATKIWYSAINQW